MLVVIFLGGKKLYESRTNKTGEKKNSHKVKKLGKSWKTDTAAQSHGEKPLGDP